jgi:hypothetical protein
MVGNIADKSLRQKRVAKPDHRLDVIVEIVLETILEVVFFVSTY